MKALLARKELFSLFSSCSVSLSSTCPLPGRTSKGVFRRENGVNFPVHEIDLGEEPPGCWEERPSAWVA